MKKLPKARSQDIVVQEFDKEILLYDLETNKAYCLNETSSLVYRACDGQTAPEELKSAHCLPDEFISLAVDDLRRENLVENDVADRLAPPVTRLRRREAIRKIGLTSTIAMPMIFSLVAPTAAHAQSATPLTCTAPGRAVIITGATTSAECRTRLESACCSGRLSVSAIACRTVRGVGSCPTCTTTCA